MSHTPLLPVLLTLQGRFPGLFTREEWTSSSLNTSSPSPPPPPSPCLQKMRWKPPLCKSSQYPVSCENPGRLSTETEVKYLFEVTKLNTSTPLPLPQVKRSGYTMKEQNIQDQAFSGQWQHWASPGSVGPGSRTEKVSSPGDHLGPGSPVQLLSTYSPISYVWHLWPKHIGSA